MRKVQVTNEDRGEKRSKCVQKVHLSWYVYMHCVYEKYPALILVFALVEMGAQMSIWDF